LAFRGAAERTALTNSWKVTLVNPSSIKPHEESIPELTRKLASEISEMGRIINPVVADVGRGLVLDGTHRVEAAIELKLPKIPVYDVDYLSDRVRLLGWARLCKRKLSVEELLKLSARHGFRKAGENEHPYAAHFIWSDGTTLSLTCYESHIAEIYRALAELEKDLRVYGVNYVRDVELETYVGTGQYGFGYLIRPLRKEEVLEVVGSGGRLPPKSTRHVVDRRPIYILFPIDMLKQKDADRLFNEWIREGRWVELPAETVADRRYDETVAVYYREDLRDLYPTKLLEMVRIS
jgi:hypothetical protein